MSLPRFDDVTVSWYLSQKNPTCTSHAFDLIVRAFYLNLSDWIECNWNDLTNIETRKKPEATKRSTEKRSQQEHCKLLNMPSMTVTLWCDPSLTEWTSSLTKAWKSERLTHWEWCGWVNEWLTVLRKASQLSPPILLVTFGLPKRRSSVSFTDSFNLSFFYLSFLSCSSSSWLLQPQTCRCIFFLWHVSNLCLQFIDHICWYLTRFLLVTRQHRKAWITEGDHGWSMTDAQNHIWNKAANPNKKESSHIVAFEI